MRRRTFQLAAKGITFSLVLTSALVMMPASYPQVEAAEISDIEAQQAQVQSELASLDSNLVQVVKQLEDLQTQISDKQQEIASTEQSIKDGQAAADQQYRDMKARMKSMYETGDNNSLLAIMAESGSLAELVSRVEYSNQLYTYDRNLLGSYKATVEEVTALKGSLESEKAELSARQGELKTTQTNLNTMISSKQGEASNLSAQLEEAKALAAKQAELERQKQEREAAARLAQIQSQNRTNQTRQANNSRDSSNNNGGNTSRKNSNNGGNTTPSKNTTNKNTSTNRNNSSNTTTERYSGGNAIVAYACQFVGRRYVWGGASLTNGADCSGFVGQVMAHFGLLSQAQADKHGYTSESLVNVGKPVAERDMQPGDIICYPGHVAIYAGNGVVVEAQNEQCGIRYGRPYNKYFGSITAIRRLGV